MVADSCRRPQWYGLCTSSFLIFAVGLNSLSCELVIAHELAMLVIYRVFARNIRVKDGPDVSVEKYGNAKCATSTLTLGNIWHSFYLCR